MGLPGGGRRARKGAQASRRGGRSTVAAARGGRRPSPFTIASVVVIVAFVAVLAVYFLTRPSARPAPVAGVPQGVQTFTNLSRAHVGGHVDYPQTPPVGGAHNQLWLNCGIYPDPVANENAVHSMEHGAVWITYQPNLPASEVATLRGTARGNPYVVLSPYPGLPAPVVASAWGVQLYLPTASDPRLAEFIGHFQQGPQTPEPGGPCSGGTGNPQH